MGEIAATCWLPMGEIAAASDKLGPAEGAAEGAAEDVMTTGAIVLESVAEPCSLPAEATPVGDVTVLCTTVADAGADGRCVLLGSTAVGADATMPVELETVVACALTADGWVRTPAEATAAPMEAGKAELVEVTYVVVV
mmetsp:Transcript_39616/g.113141  ORF Transcript_39616/g.113141 Transcript_39616/m.113141 type:complete len:139 (-) Transcript_39616:183-599(-)